MIIIAPSDYILAKALKIVDKLPEIDSEAIITVFKSNSPQETIDEMLKTINKFDNENEKIFYVFKVGIYLALITAVSSSDEVNNAVIFLKAIVDCVQEASDLDTAKKIIKNMLKKGVEHVKSLENHNHRDNGYA